MANAKYAIWNKKDLIYTPVGEELSAEEWLARYSWLKPSRAVPVVAAGLINGAFCGELSQMKQYAERAGATFNEGLSDEELLDAIAAFEDAQNAPNTDPTAEERIAAALEYQNLASMPDAGTV